MSSGSKVPLPLLSVETAYYYCGGATGDPRARAMGADLSTLPAFTRFHVAIGFTGVACGAVAMALRAPDFLCLRMPPRASALARFWHSVAGAGFLICCLFMPITANWVWPRLGTPYVIIILIPSMYIGLVLGIVAIRVFRGLNTSNSHDGKGTAAGVDVALEGGAAGAVSDEEGRGCPSFFRPACKEPKRRGLWLKYAHAILMIFSWVLLLGGGQAFLSNARVGGFPYPQGDLTDSLVGRCYARDLTDAAAPSWLTSLHCGLGSFCVESSGAAGGRNRYSL